MILQAEEIICYTDKLNEKKVYLIAKIDCDKCDLEGKDESDSKCYVCEGTGITKTIIPDNKTVELINKLICRQHRLLSEIYDLNNGSKEVHNV